jgi:hypothetical protein
MKRFGLIVPAVILLAQETDPITDRMRYEIAVAQRDLLIARQQYEQAAAQLKMKLEQVNKVCSAKRDGQTFNSSTFVCETQPKMN